MNSFDLSQLPEDPYDTADAQMAQQTSSAFSQSAQATMESLGDMPAELAMPIKEFIWKHEQQTRLLSRSARATLGDPQVATTYDPQTRQIFKGNVYPQAGSAENTLARKNTLAEIAQAIKYAEFSDQIEAQLLVDQVFLASAAEIQAPPGTSEGRISEIKSDIEQLIAAEGSGEDVKELRQYVAAKLLHEAVFRGDDALISTLMGPRMELTRQRFGLNAAQLARVLFRARMEATQARLDKNNPSSAKAAALNGTPREDWKYAHGRPKHAQFLARQLQQETVLGRVALDGAAHLRHAHESTRKRSPR